MRVHVFTGHNGVVDDNTQHNNKGECTNQVQANVEQVHRDKCTQKADRDSQKYPERDRGTQEQ